MKKDSLYNDALAYHRAPNGPGKISITPTKAVMTQRDLALAYSPGVAAPCEEIVANPAAVSEYTARGNLVAVITNGTAVLGLGNIGPLAAKPVMEGKSVLFKKFSGIDAIDVEIAETDVDRLVDIIASLEPSFGAINLEDIKSPECFEVERRLKERMKIPVFHDDQHGTAIIVATAFRNWITYSGRNIKEVKIVTAGAGAAAMACVTLLAEMGVPKKNILLTDLHGVVHKGRNEEMDEVKKPFAQETKLRTLKEAIKGADVFLGLSAPGVLNQAMLKSMGKAPLIMALANPTPEIMPEEAREARPDAIICTGRSDYPNQVNNALCFPFIFRGALDVGATAINEKMKVACVEALSKLTMAEATAEVAAVYGDVPLQFGPEYLIPKPFDPRLILELPPAVARAAMESGVATRPIEDFAAYRARLEKYVYKSGQLMRPMYARAAANPKRVAFAEGEEMRVLHAAQTLIEDRIARPVLVGRAEVILARIAKLGLHMKKGRDFDIVNPEDDPRFNDYWQTYHKIMERKGITPATARQLVRTRNTLIAALLVRKDDADAMICGTIGRYDRHYQHIIDVIGTAEGVRACASLSIMILPKGTFFLCDAFVNHNPSAEDLCDMALLAAEEMKRFGMEPRIALLSRSDFGSIDCPDAVKMREATQMIKDRAPELEVEGEMTGSAALSEEIRERLFPNSELKGQANLLVMPNIDAANIAFHLLKILGDGIVVGPLLLGAAKPAHVMIPSVTSRGIANAAAYACAGAAEPTPAPLAVLGKKRRKSDRPDKKRAKKRT
ncbi:MAG: NADP-dependent malic enzyme [Alphaproteobacteria bacterium]|nr:NADP-dependent malic enzyme [Alphaproteobacteria bacterium]MDE2337501.1 NADP-dependent malic enzyme [Alphaproteobacteria bacterium]